MRLAFSAIILALSLSIKLSEPALASPLNKWSTSCGADSGAIDRDGRTWSFGPSKNYCDNFFAQRTEISTEPVSPTHAGSYLFTTTVSFRNDEPEEFSIFSIHDAREGCAPPFQLYVKPDGRLWPVSDIKTGPGESCIRGYIGNGLSKGKLNRDGTPQELKILVTFDGIGAFDITVWVDNQVQVQGRYSGQDGAYRSKKFYFKHGVYAQNKFNFELVSQGMTVKRVRIAEDN